MNHKILVSYFGNLSFVQMDNLEKYDECFCLTNTETLHRLFNNIDQHILQIIIGRVRQKHQQTVTREYFNMSLFNNMNYYYEMKRRKNTYILCVSG